MDEKYYGSEEIEQLRRKIEDDDLTLSRPALLQLFDYIEALETAISFAADMGGVEDTESESIVARVIQEEYENDKLPEFSEFNDYQVNE